MGVKIYKIVTVILTVGCIIGGSIFHISGFVSRLTPVFNWFPFIHIESDKDWSTGDVKTYEMEDSDEFETIWVDASLMDVEVKVGETYSCAFTTDREKLCPTMRVEDDTLYVEQKDTKSTFDYNLNENMKYNARLVITVPEGESLDDVTIETDLGEVTLKDIACDNVNLTSDLGAVTVKNVEADSIVGCSNLGSVCMEDCEGKTLSAETELGESRISCKEADTITATSEMGSAVVEITELGANPQITIQSQMGNAELICGVDPDAYDISINTEMGDVTYLGSGHGTHYSTGGKKGNITVETEMGSAVVKEK